MHNNLTYGKIDDLFPKTGTVVIADDYFRASGRLEKWGCPVLWVHASEEAKTLETVADLTAQLRDLTADMAVEAEKLITEGVSPDSDHPLARNARSKKQLAKKYK